MGSSFVSKKLVSGFLSLSLRRAALLAINFITINLILARFLPVSYIGIFNIANSILSFFTFFSDIGLAAALIQKKAITEEDLQTTFTVQEILSLLITLIIFLIAPDLALFFRLDSASIWLIRSLAVGFFLTTLKVIPSVLLEREIDFKPLVFVEIVESVVFNSLLIFFSLQKFGVYAFSWSVLFRSLTGVAILFVLSPWKVSLGLQKENLKALLSFGIPFQLNSILALLKDRLVPLVIARMVGPVGVGYITWSQAIAFVPLEVVNIISRITFPAFSRLQDDKKALKEILEKSFFFTTLFLYPLLFGLLALSPSLIKFVVSNKWQPALPLIYLFSVNVFWAALSIPSTNFLNAIGKIKVTLKLMVMWTFLEWSLTPLLTVFYGYWGVAVATAIIAFTSIIPILIIKKVIKIEIIKNIWQPLIASLLMSGATYFFARYLVTNYITLLISVLFGGIIYLILVFTMARKRIMEHIKEFKNV